MMAALICMYIASAALPIAGIFRLLKAAKKDAAAMLEASPPGGGGASQVGVAVPIIVSSIQNRPDQLLVDFWLIGSGVALGAVAGILSLF